MLNQTEGFRRRHRSFASYLINNIASWLETVAACFPICITHRVRPNAHRVVAIAASQNCSWYIFFTSHGLAWVSGLLRFFFSFILERLGEIEKLLHSLLSRHCYQITPQILGRFAGSSWWDCTRLFLSTRDDVVSSSQG